MKRITKKLVREALEGVYGGWNFAYDFKDSQRLILQGNDRTDAAIVNALAARGVAVVEHTPRGSHRTGSIKLWMPSGGD